VLLEYFWWGSVFLVNVPVMVLLLVLGPRLLPEYRDPNAGRLDVISAAQSLAAILAVIYGIKRFAQGDDTWAPIAAIVLGVVVGMVFVRRQQTLTGPLIDLSLFRSRAFSASLAINIVGFFVAFGTFLAIAQYLQLVLGMTLSRPDSGPRGTGWRLSRDRCWLRRSHAACGPPTSSRVVLLSPVRVSWY
jgi:MFS transporter, DHA2 family, multidrug resistance protein